MMKIKICGLFRDRDIDYVNAAKPDYAGFVFAPSRRKVSAATADRLRSRLKRGITPVGVFVGADVADIAALYNSGVIELAQLHGGEDARYIESLRAICAVPIISAVLMDAPNAIEAANALPVDYLLLDNGGGTGKAFDWGVIRGVDKPFFLAGGINAANIERAAGVRPYAVDISSGAETRGIKDFDKIKSLVKSVREGN